MGLSAAAQPHFQAREAEQRAMVRGAEERLREYRRLLPGGDRAGALDGRFWDAVVLTAANERQAETYVQQLDALHARGQLPGARERYLVIPDPPGPRVGSGGATLHVMLRLQAVAGSGWSGKKLFLLHAGGYSERSPAHGTLGKAFGQIPFDAAGVGVPATVLEAQLVSFQELPSRLPNGIFISSADVAVQFGALPRLGPDAIARAREGILALAHASSVEVGTGHGVFVCEREQLDARVRAAVAVVGDADADAGDASEQNAADSFAAVACRRCLQKPSVAAMRAAGAVLPGPRLAGYGGGSAGEWVLTDSAFHVGADACSALVAVAAAHPRAFAGVEVCAYGDLMQPMGEDADTSYLGRTDHVASVSSGAERKGASDEKRAAEAENTVTKLRRARELLAETMRGRPLLALPLVPSRFVHVGTMPELLQHCVRDDDVLAAFPAPSAGIALGTWDVEKMDPAGTQRMPSVGADGVWGSAPGVGVGSCFLASRVGRGARVGAGSLLVHCDLGRQTVVGEGCLLHDVDLPHGARVPPGTFLHCVPLVAAAAAAAGVPPRASSARDPSNDLSGGGACWTCIALSVDDEVKKPGKSTLCGVPVETAAARLGLDPAEGDVVWAEGEARTTTLARVFPVGATAAEAASAALDLIARVRQKTSAAREKKIAARLSVSISEALRSLAAHGAAVRRREALRGRVIGHAVGMLLAKDTPVEQWRVRAPPLRACRVREAREVCARAELCSPAARGAEEEKCAARASTRAKLALGRVALALASSDEETREAEAIARAALRDTIVAPFVRASAPLFGRRSRSGVSAGAARPETSDEKNRPTKTFHTQYAVRAEYPARLNLAGGWTDTPPYCLERGGAVLHVAVLTEESVAGSSSGGGRLRRPIAATVSVLTDGSARGVVRLVTDAARGAEAQTETVASTRELLRHDDPTHAFALLRAAVCLAVCPECVPLGEKEKEISTPLPELAAALEAFTGVPDAGLEVRARVDLPRGSGLGTSSVLALALLHALHEAGTRRRWEPGGLGPGETWAGRTNVLRFDEKGGVSEEVDARASASREKSRSPSARDAFNAVLAVEQMMTTGGGWQDQIGGALEGARLTRSRPGSGPESFLSDELTSRESKEDVAAACLPSYATRAVSLPPAAAAFLSRRLVCVFTGTCRLAATVARSVVDAWTRRAPGVEKALRACAALGAEMADALDRLGALETAKNAAGGSDAPFDAASRGHFAGAGSAEARAALAALGAALERHRQIQEELWPSIASPTVKALYDALEPVSLGSHICGAGNGGHVVALLKPDATPAAAAAAVAACSAAPEARVVRVQMMLGGDHGHEEASATAETAPREPVAPTAGGGRTKERDERAEEKARDEDKAAAAAAAAGHPDPAARAAGAGGSGGRGRGGRGGEGVSGRGRKKRRTG